jgi:peptide/nickel transport system substrate-binding protein
VRAVSRIFLTLLLPAAIPIAGCAPKATIDEGTPVIAFPGASSSINPRMATDTCGTQILQMTHASLIRMNAAGNPVPDLAENREERAPTEIVFRLRKEVRFHDGRELTCATPSRGSSIPKTGPRTGACTI